MGKPLVEITHLTKKIGKKTIIDDLSFNVYQGEVFGFLGPNGAGKTTTIRMLVGLMKITSGEVVIKGKNITSEFEEAISEIGAIVENPEMYKFLTGYQNLVHYARMVNGIKKERIDEVVELVGLTARIHEKVQTYSLGMRQRLGLAQALLHSPSLLVLDEPTNGLDPAGIREVRDHIRKLAKEEGNAVIVSGHLLSEMEMMCDRIGIIQQGKLIGEQAMTDLIQPENDRSVRFEVSNVEMAIEVLKHKLHDVSFNVHENILEIPLEKTKIPEINRLFVVNNIDVYAIQQMSKSLEEKFLEVTGGKPIV